MNVETPLKSISQGMSLDINLEYFWPPQEIVSMRLVITPSTTSQLFHAQY